MELENSNKSKKENKESKKKSKTESNINTTLDDLASQKAIFTQEFKKNLSEEIKIKLWIRTLLCSYRVLPKIVNAVDKIIMERASNYSFSANVFNASRCLENQINIVIDMSERKKKLLNIYIMVKRLFQQLPEDYFDFAEKKFFDESPIEEIAEEYNISTRSVFRRTNEIIDFLYKFVTKKNWTLKFIELQVKDEDWLIEKYNINLNEYVGDSIKKDKWKVF